MTIKEERNMVLEMLADGKITVEESEKLLQALEESQPKPKRKRGLRAIRSLPALPSVRAIPAIPAIPDIYGAQGDERFLEMLDDLGYEDITREEYHQIRIHGITPRYIKDMIDVLGDELEIDEIDRKSVV